MNWKLTFLLSLLSFGCLQPVFGAKVFTGIINEETGEATIELPADSVSHQVTFLTAVNSKATSAVTSYYVFGTVDSSFGTEFGVNNSFLSTSTYAVTGTLENAGTYQLFYKRAVINSATRELLTTLTGLTGGNTKCNYSIYSDGYVELTDGTFSQTKTVSSGQAFKYTWPMELISLTSMSHTKRENTGIVTLNLNSSNEKGFSITGSFNATSHPSLTYTQSGTFSATGYIVIPEEYITIPGVNTLSLYAIDWDAEGNDVAQLREDLERIYKELLQLIKEGDENILAQVKLLIENLKVQLEREIADAKAETDAKINASVLELKALISNLEKVVETKFADIYAKLAEQKAELESELAKKVNYADLDYLCDERLEGHLDGLEEDFDDVMKQIEEYDEKVRDKAIELTRQIDELKADLLQSETALRAEYQAKIDALDEGDPLYAEKVATLKAELAASLASMERVTYEKVSALDLERDILLFNSSSEVLSAKLREIRRLMNRVEAALTVDESTEIEEFAEIIAVAPNVETGIVDVKLTVLHEMNDYELDKRIAATGYPAKIEELSKRMAILEEMQELTFEEVKLRIKNSEAYTREQIASYKLAVEIYVNEIFEQFKEITDGLQKQIDALTREMSKRMQTLEDRIAYIIMTDESLESKRSGLKSLVEKYQNQVLELELLIAEKKSKGEDYSALQKELDAVLALLETSKADLDNVEYVIGIRADSEFAKQKRTIEELTRYVAEIQVVMEDLQTGQIIQDERLAALEKLVASLQNTIDRINGQIAGLNSSVKEIETLRKELAALAAYMDTLSNTVSNLSLNGVTGTGGYFDAYDRANTYDINNKGADTMQDNRDLRTDADSSLKW